MFKDILVAVDGSDHSRKALEKAVQTANAFGARLTVLEVIEEFGVMPVYFGYPGYYQIPSGTDDQTEAIANKRLNELLPALNDLKGSFQRRILKGDPADVILKEAESGSYDLLITGSRGNNALKRLILGSVSTHLATHCRKNLLIVHS